MEEIKGKGYNLSQVRDYVEKTRGIKYSYKGVWNILRRWLKVPYGKPYVLIRKQSETASEELKKSGCAAAEVSSAFKRTKDIALNQLEKEKVILGFLDESTQ